MTPKEKAIKLTHKFYDKFYRDDDSSWEHAKKCALICVDEMIKQNGELYLNGINEQYYRKKNGELFELKQEIEEL